MKTIFNKSLDLQDMKNILANIDDLTEVYKNGQAKCEAMELDLKHRLEFDELTDEQILHVGRGLQKVLRRRREYKDEIRDLTTELCEKTDATLVRIIGFTVILFREAEEEEDRKIKL